MRFQNFDIEPTVAEIGPQTQVLQFIHAALVAGVLVFFGIQLVNNPKFSEVQESVPLIPLCVAISGMVFSFIVPRLLRQAALTQLQTQPPITTGSIFNVFQIGHIVGIALLEGAAFLACISLGGIFGEVPRWFLGVPVVLIVVMLLRFPRKTSIAQWIVDRRAELIQ